MHRPATAARVPAAARSPGTLRVARPTTIALLLVALLVAVPAADAHAGRVRGLESPLAGARLDAIPMEVSVVVSEPLEPDGSSLRVTRSDGVRVDVGPTRIDDPGSATPRLSVSLRTDAGDGAYTVTLQTLSTVDGHPWTESFGFAVGDHEPPAFGARSSKVPVDAAAGRFLALTGLSLGLGAALWLVWMPGAGAPVPRRYVHEALVGAGLAHTVGLLLLIHATAAASGLGLGAFVASSVGRLLAVRLILGAGALLLAGLSLHPLTQTRSGPLLASALLAVAGLVTSRLGHASVAGIAGVAVDFMHLLPAATWVGGLAVMLWVLSNAAGHLTVREVRMLGLRFGTAALACVLLLVVAGLATTATIVGLDAWRHPLRLLGSPWGAFLAAKVGLTGAMLASAAANRLVILAPPTDTGLAGLLQRLAGRAWGGLRSLDAVADARGLRRVVATEALLGVLILALAGALTSVAPPAAAADDGESLGLTGSGDAHHVSATVAPLPAAGETSSLSVIVATHDGRSVTSATCTHPACVSATVEYARTDDEAQRYDLAADATGAWTTDAVLWARAGNATLAIAVQPAAGGPVDTILLRLTIA